ncbi:MAG: AAA family ATPase [Candidatus Bathyarchaeota archaeon]|nr:MAG: AAA family ATPase [Candidatus Bathyarchaeota archaeon]
MGHRIGLVYVSGALPCFESFGNLPTDLVQEDALVDGKPASDVLDMMIVPGGSLVESQSINTNIQKEIIKMADAGKFVLGICSGFQILSNATDIGRLSPTPIMRKGLGLLDVQFQPLICTDRVKATIIGKSFITNPPGETVTGFHCHTYGKIVPGKQARPIIVSRIQRFNYRSNPQDFVSGFSNKEGNVVGILTHGLLDENPVIVQSIIKSLDISPKDLQKIKTANSLLVQKVKNEIGVSINLQPEKKYPKPSLVPVILFTTATGSGSGKTFIVTGVAGALKKRGINLGLLKIGGDIRDIVPALYLIKESMKPYSSLRLANSGWTPIFEAVNNASKDYDFLVIEGAMGPFTGFLNETVKRPATTAEIAVALGVPTVVVVACDKAGVEGATVIGLSYVNLLKTLGIKVVGIILNKVHTSYFTPKIRDSVESAFNNVGVELIGIIPKIQLEGRGAIPEIEIDYKEFGDQAIKNIEESLDLDALIRLAAPPVRSSVSYETVLKKFKQLLDTGFALDETTGDAN